jgi:signal transduction histidine kinase
LASSALPPTPNGKDYARSDDKANENTEEESDDIKYTINETLQTLSRVRHRFDNCGDVRYPSYSEAVVSISDSGEGIDPEVMSRLFEEFVSKSEKGTGLGLFISKSIVEAHGGKIWGENNKGLNGATFTFTLPLAV